MRSGSPACSCRRKRRVRKTDRLGHGDTPRPQTPAPNPPPPTPAFQVFAPSRSEDSLGGVTAHADAVGNADAAIRIAGYVKSRNGGHTRFHFCHPVGMAYCVLRHGRRPSEDACEMRLGAEPGDLLQLGAHSAENLV